MPMVYGEAFAQNIQIILVFLINIQKILNRYEFFLIFYNNMFLCASAIQCFMWQKRQVKIPQFGVKTKGHKFVDHKINLPSRHILFDRHNVSKNCLTPNVK